MRLYGYPHVITIETVKLIGELQGTGNRATQVVRDPATETRLSHGARRPWGSISLNSLNIYEGSTIEKADFQTSLFSLS